jgi:predicted DNA binding CopG/RHH family protein
MSSKKPTAMPKFANESEEADWWASPAGRDYVKRKSRARNLTAIKDRGSKLVAALKKRKSTQIAIRLPETDIEQARKLADRKGIGYQTLLRMIVHEGLQRENRRQ